MDVRAALAEEGYAIVRGLLSGEEVARVAAAFDRLLARARVQPHGERSDSSFVISNDPFALHRVVWAGDVDAELALGDDPRWLRLAADALGQRDLVQLIQQAHYKLPGDGVAFSWHQDASNRRYGSELWTDVDGRGSFVQIALAVDAMTRENGPLRVIAGSQRLGFVADPRTGALPPALIAASRARELLLDPGDVAVFGPFLVHGSAPNQGSAARRLFLQGYALPGANRRTYQGAGLGVARRAPAPEL